MISRIAGRLPLYIKRGASSPVRFSVAVDRPAIPISGIIVNEPVEASSACVETILRILVIPNLCLEPANAPAILSVPIRPVVLIEAFQHIALPVRVLWSRRHVAVPAVCEVVLAGGRLMM